MLINIKIKNQQFLSQRRRVQKPREQFPLPSPIPSTPFPQPKPFLFLLQPLLFFYKLTYRWIPGYFLFAQVLDPAARLGCDQMGGYHPLKAHLFYKTVVWENVPNEQPPKIMPYLPSTSKGETGFRSDVNVRAEVNRCAVTMVIV